MAQSELCFSGAAVVGGVRTSLPTTTLTVTQELIILRLFPFGVYYFSPKNVISIEQVNKTRICIRHAIRDYPSKISFISIDSKDIAQRIKEMGFAPSCRGLDSLFSIPRSGSPVYWQVILGSLLWWNGLLFLGSSCSVWHLFGLSSYTQSTNGSEICFEAWQENWRDKTCPFSYSFNHWSFSCSNVTCLDS
jgi:hypothetical protein